MFGRIFLTALAAGVLSGFFIWGAHSIKTTPLILAAEAYENQGKAAGDSLHQVSPSAYAATAATVAEEEEWGPADGFERNAYTLLSDVLASIGFAFLLTGVIAFSGRHVDWRRGIVWGLCGFAAFFVSPSLGLAPELPGMQAAELSARQAWWLSTVAAAIAGLALIALQPRVGLKWVGAGLIIVPHLVGAPHPEIAPGALPAELAAQFAATTLVVTGLFWMVLGGLTGYFYNRFEPS